MNTLFITLSFLFAAVAGTVYSYDGDAKLSGVGNVTLSGTAGQADISKGGIGDVNTNNLKIGR